MIVQPNDPRSSQQPFAPILSNLRSLDPNIKKIAERKIISCQQQDPNVFVAQSISIIKDMTTSSDIRVRASICLKEYFSRCPKYWFALDINVQSELKATVFDLIIQIPEESEVHSSLLYLFTQIIKDATDCSSNENKNTCPADLLPKILLLSQSSDAHKILLSLRLLQIFLKNCICGIPNEELTNIYALINKCISHSSIDIKNEAAMAYLYTIHLKWDPVQGIDITYFYLKNTMATVLEAVKNNHEQVDRLFEALGEAIRSNTMLFYKNLFTFIQGKTLQILKMPEVSGSNKIKLLKKFTGIMKRTKEFVLNGEQANELISNIIEIIATQIVKDSNANDVCCHPAGELRQFQGGQEAIDDSNLFSCVEHIFMKMHTNDIIPFLSNLLSTRQSGGVADWRHHYALLKVIQPLRRNRIPYPQNEILDFICTSLQDLHPKVRDAAVEALAQLGKDSIKFHTVNNETIRRLLNARLNDPIPSVASSVGCLYIYVQNCNIETSVSDLDDLAKRLLRILKQDTTSMVTEDVIRTLGWVASKLRSNYQKYTEESIEIMFEILHKHPQNVHQRLRGRARVCCNSICIAVSEMDQKTKYIDQLICNAIEESYDISDLENYKPLKLAAEFWQILVIYFKNEVQSKFKVIWSTVLRLFDVIFPDKFIKATHITVPQVLKESELGARLASLNLLSRLSQIAMDSSDFAEETVRICKKALRCDTITNDEIEKILPILMSIVTNFTFKPSNHQVFAVIIQDIIIILFELQTAQHKDKLKSIVRDCLEKVFKRTNGEMLDKITLKWVAWFIDDLLGNFNVSYEEFLKTPKDNRSEYDSPKIFKEFGSILKIARYLVISHPKEFGTCAQKIMSIPFVSSTFSSCPKVYHSYLNELGSFLLSYLECLSSELLTLDWFQILVWILRLADGYGLNSSTKDFHLLFVKITTKFPEIFNRFAVDCASDILKSMEEYGYISLDGKNYPILLGAVIKNNNPEIDPDTLNKLFRAWLEVLKENEFEDQKVLLELLCDVLLQYPERLYHDDLEFDFYIKYVLQFFNKAIKSNLLDDEVLRGKVKLVMEFFECHDTLREDVYKVWYPEYNNIVKVLKYL